jgi:hypothetical protein
MPNLDLRGFVRIGCLHRQALLHHAAAVDDAAQSRVQRVDQRGDRGEQEDGRHRQLDDATDIGELCFHGGSLA